MTDNPNTHEHEATELATALAKATGAREVTVTVDRRDPGTGQLVTMAHVVTPAEGA